jgi:kinesin family protein 5
MMGPDGGKGMEDLEMKGIVPRIVMQIFDAVDQADENLEFVVKVSFLEIYMERIRDLLDVSRDNLRVREDGVKGVWVEGATEVYCACEEDVMNVLRVGQVHRSVAATKMNAESSRSHSIFIVMITQKNIKTGGSKSGKLYLVDLAGSEKVGKTGAEGQTLEEAKMINKSLTALGQVINALTDPKAKHIPYRDSKLTRLLQNSLGGNSRTTLCINCSPSDYNYGETLSTLRFGQRAKSIKNNAKVNQERSAAELMALLAETEKTIALLKTYIDILIHEVLSLSPGHVIPPMSSLKAQSAETHHDDGVRHSDAVAASEDQRLSDEEVGEAGEGGAPIDFDAENFESQPQDADAFPAPFSPPRPFSPSPPPSSPALPLSEREEELQHELTEKLGELDKILKSSESLREELLRAEAVDKEFKVQHKVLLGKIADLEIVRDHHEYESSQNAFQIEELSSQKALLTTEVAELQQSISSLQERLENQNKLIEQMGVQSREEAPTEEQNETKEKDTTDVKMKPTALSGLKELEEAFAALQKENEFLRSEQQKLESSISSLDFAKIAREIEENAIVPPPVDPNVVSFQEMSQQFHDLEKQHRLLRQLTAQKFKVFQRFIFFFFLFLIVDFRNLIR